VNPFRPLPGRKLQYFEPIFDLMVELKNRLYNPNLSIFVVSYTFRDHIYRLVQHASERNHDSSAYEIYQNNLRCYKDIAFVHSFWDNARRRTNEAWHDIWFANLACQIFNRLMNMTQTGK
jgi:hypothetical protein